VIAETDLGRFLSRYAIKSAWVFYPLAAVFVAYLLYMVVRKRRGERAGAIDREPEL
jgi:phosphate/sulfate permease